MTQYELSRDGSKSYRRLTIEQGIDDIRPLIELQRQLRKICK